MTRVLARLTQSAPHPTTRADSVLMDAVKLLQESRDAHDAAISVILEFHCPELSDASKRRIFDSFQRLTSAIDRVDVIASQGGKP